MPAQVKLKLVCECCGFETPQLEIIKKHLMYCNECSQAEKRRERFRQEEKEWNKGVDQKETE